MADGNSCMYTIQIAVQLKHAPRPPPSPPVSLPGGRSARWRFCQRGRDRTRPSGARRRGRCRCCCWRRRRGRRRSAGAGRGVGRGGCQGEWAVVVLCGVVDGRESETWLVGPSYVVQTHNQTYDEIVNAHTHLCHLRQLTEAQPHYPVPRGLRQLLVLVHGLPEAHTLHLVWFAYTNHSISLLHGACIMHTAANHSPRPFPPFTWYPPIPSVSMPFFPATTPPA